jgi:hypothetical protein
MPAKTAGTGHEPREDLPEAADPFRSEDRLPDRRQRDGQYDESGQQSDRERESVLLEIGQRYRGDHQGGARSRT